MGPTPICKERYANSTTHTSLVAIHNETIVLYQSSFSYVRNNLICLLFCRRVWSIWPDCTAIKASYRYSRNEMVVSVCWWVAKVAQVRFELIRHFPHTLWHVVKSVAGVNILFSAINHTKYLCTTSKLSCLKICIIKCGQWFIFIEDL